MKLYYAHAKNQVWIRSVRDLIWCLLELDQEDASDAAVFAECFPAR